MEQEAEKLTQAARYERNETLRGAALIAADINGDGEVTIADATHLQRYIAEFEGIVLGKQAHTKLK